MNMFHEDMEGLAMIEEWPNSWEANSNNSNSNDNKPEKMVLQKNETQSPLLNHVVLQKMFSCLDETELKKSRQVCQVWNYESLRLSPAVYKVYEVPKVHGLLNIINNLKSDPCFVRHLVLESNAVWEAKETLNLLWKLRRNLRTLKIKIPDTLSYAFTVFCTSSYIDARIIDKDTALPSPEDNPFPNLTHLQISGGVTANGFWMLKLFLDRVTSINRISLHKEIGVTEDGFSDEEDSPSSANTQIGIKMLGEYVQEARGTTGRFNTLDARSPYCFLFLEGIQEQMNTKQTSTSCLSTLSFHQYYNRNLLSNKAWTSTVSNIIRAASQTLRRLAIIDTTADTWNTTIPDNVSRIKIECELPQLNHLCLVDVILEATTPGIYNMFPKLQHFELCHCSSPIGELDEDDSKKHYQTLFPDIQNSEQLPIKVGDICNYLENLYLYTYLVSVADNSKIVRQISLRFPHLRRLLLEANGALLVDVVTLLKDLPIESFTLRYFEADEESKVTFDSSMTGISIQECQRLLSSSLDEKYYLDRLDQGVLKTQRSLVDWKHLHTFNLTYKTAEHEEHLQGNLDWLFLNNCLLLLKEMKHLELRYFKIREDLLCRLVKKTDLTTLRLGNCKISSLRDDFSLLSTPLERSVEEMPALYGKRLKMEYVEDDTTPNHTKLLYYFNNYSSLV